jgi:hypothetical protein
MHRRRTKTFISFRQLLKHVYTYHHQSLIFLHFFLFYCVRTRLDDNEDVDRISSRKTTHIHKCLIAFSFFFFDDANERMSKPSYCSEGHPNIYERDK